MPLILGIKGLCHACLVYVVKIANYAYLCAIKSSVKEEITVGYI